VTCVSDLEGEFSHSMKRFPAGLVLIRPDRYVAAFLGAENLEAGIPEVNGMIAETWK